MMKTTSSNSGQTPEKQRLQLSWTSSKLRLLRGRLIVPGIPQQNSDEQKSSINKCAVDQSGKEAAVDQSGKEAAVDQSGKEAYENSADSGLGSGCCGTSGVGLANVPHSHTENKAENNVRTLPKTGSTVLLTPTTSCGKFEGSGSGLIPPWLAFFVVALLGVLVLAFVSWLLRQ
jgi:hypothetical protein